RAQFREVLDLLTASRNRPILMDVLEMMAELAACMKQPRQGVRLSAAAAAMRERSGELVAPVDRAYIDHRKQRLRAALEEKIFEEEWTSGLALTMEEAVELAQEMLAEPSA